MDQKNDSPLAFINPTTRALPIVLMTTNRWTCNGTWRMVDFAALSKRFCIILHFERPLPPAITRTMTPSTFRMDMPCAGCAKKLQHWCIEAYKANPDLAAHATAHLEEGADLKQLHPKLIDGDKNPEDGMWFGEGKSLFD